MHSATHIPHAYSQKYTVVCFLHTQRAGVVFSASEWPLHITMLDTFKTEWSQNTLERALETVAQHTAPLDVVPDKQAMLGPNKDVPVKLIRQDEAVLALHNKLLGLSANGSFVYNTPEFVGSGFLPHVTDQQSGSAQIGTTYHLASISLVDMFPDGDHTRRAVVSNHVLYG